MENKIIIKNKQSEHFNLITYPDGQHNVLLHLKTLNVKKKVKIRIRANNWQDLEVLACVVAALKRNDFCCIHIEFVYLFGLRSDRAFRQGEPNYLREVLAPFIKNLGAYEVSILCPHSSFYAYEYMSAHTYLQDLTFMKNEAKILIGGDQSFNFEDYFFEDEYEIYKFHKQRSPDGIQAYLDQDAITNLIVSAGLDITKPICIVDDLCDGGATFIAEALYLKNVLGIKNPLHLFIFHGIFSQGFDDLLMQFDKITTTNSYQDFPEDIDKRIEIIKVI